jgi:adenylate cyclase
MSHRVLILQSEKTDSEALSEYFRIRGDKVLVTSDSTKVCQTINRLKPDFIFIDLHMPGEEWITAIKCIQKQFPDGNVIMTNKHADVRRELIAREHGVKIFLRFPFDPEWIENALQKCNQADINLNSDDDSTDKLPRVKIPMRLKITLPYALLAVFFALAAAFLVSRYVFESLQDRFLIQLIDTAQLTADWMVQEESRILETLRLLAHTEGLVNAIEERDAERLREIIIPLMINYSEEAIHILDAHGASVLSLRQVTGGGVGDYEISSGDTTLGTLPFFKKVINNETDSLGDKFAGLAQVPSGDYLYIVGPIVDANGTKVGVVAVGKSLSNLVKQIRQDTLGQVSIYGVEGNLLATTLLVEDEVDPISNVFLSRLLYTQDEESLIRELSIASTEYSEILGPWEVRGGQDLGFIGTSLAQNYLARPTMLTRLQIFLIVIIAVAGVISLGIFLAYQVTNPLSQIVHAAIEVARGNLEVKITTSGNDEVTVLSHAFNYMVSGLQEGFIYRDLLGRSVSPQVREELRHSFASGNIRLEGQNTVGTILMSDIRGFTAISEKEKPTTILNWLNEYFGEVVPVITSRGGVVDKFEGDSMLAFFGILPTPLPAEESAYFACKAAIEMQDVIEKINKYRAKRGEPALITGIGINTGSLTAGGLGTSDRMNYTVIGDTVNTTQRIEGFTNRFGGSGIVVSETTLSSLKNHREEFRFEPLGEHALKGKMELMWLYRLYPLKRGKS